MRGGLFNVIVATVMFLVGISVESPGPRVWVLALGFAIIGVCIAGIFIMTWIDHLRGRHQRADMWEREQQQKLYGKQLDAFWRSPAGRWVKKSPFLANDSVRIEPIKGGQTPKTYLGLLALRISKTHVAYAQTVIPVRWNHRAMDFVIWLVSHHLLPAWAWRWLGKRLGYKFRNRR